MKGIRKAGPYGAVQDCISSFPRRYGPYTPRGWAAARPGGPPPFVRQAIAEAERLPGAGPEFEPPWVRGLVLAERLTGNHSVRRKPYCGGHASKALEERRFPKRLAPRRGLFPKQKQRPFTVRAEKRWSTKVHGEETQARIKALPIAGTTLSKWDPFGRRAPRWPAPLGTINGPLYSPPNPARAELERLVADHLSRGGHPPLWGPSGQLISSKIIVRPPEMTSYRLSRLNRGRNVRAGRPCVGDRPMTQAERKARQRRLQRERRKLTELRRLGPLQAAARPAPRLVYPDRVAGAGHFISKDKATHD